MKNYVNEEIKFNGCPGCAYANHEFSLPCGMVYENEEFTLSQDWEFPIEGFFIVSIKRHVERIVDLTEHERNEMFGLAVKIMEILKKNNICEQFEVIFYEKDDTHLHAWVMPRHEWMRELVGNITGNIGTILAYAKKNFSNQEVYDRIASITEIVKKNFK